MLVPEVAKVVLLGSSVSPPCRMCLVSSLYCLYCLMSSMLSLDRLLVDSVDLYGNADADAGADVEIYCDCRTL